MALQPGCQVVPCWEPEATAALQTLGWTQPQVKPHAHLPPGHTHPHAVHKKTQEGLTASLQGWTPGSRAGQGLSWADAGRNQPAKRHADTGEVGHEQGT